jgi:hypothetical protein
MMTMGKRNFIGRSLKTDYAVQIVAILRSEWKSGFSVQAHFGRRPL